MHKFNERIKANDSFVRIQWITVLIGSSRLFDIRTANACINASHSRLAPPFAENMRGVQCRREWGGGGGGLAHPNNFLTSGVFSKNDSYIIITKVL